MKNFFSFTRRKGPSTTRIRGDANRHSIGSHSSVSNRSLVIQLIRGAYNIDLAKVDQSFSKLHKACFLNYDIVKIKKYLKQGANPNQLDNVSRSSPLHLATVNGNINVIRLLIESGGNIDLPDGDGKTPLIKAIECFHKECLQFLILQGSDLNVGDNQLGNTALHWSIINNFADGFKLLIAYSQRIDVNKKNKAGESPLHLLVRVPDLHKYVGDLLDKGAEIDIRNNQQRTPLMIACEHGHLELTRILVNRGSYIYHQDEAGFSALGIAKRNDHSSLVQYLTDLGGFESPRQSVVQVKSEPNWATDSWPSTEEEDEEDEEEITAAKTRKFDPIIQQLKSLQGIKQDDKLLQASETSQQSKASGQFEQATKSSFGRESNYEEIPMGTQKILEVFTRNQKEEVSLSSREVKGDDDDDEMADNVELASKEIGLPVKNLNVSADPTLGHIDSVYSHETSNDEFIREIKNLLDEEIRENDELDALLFAATGNDNIKVNDTNEKNRIDHIDHLTLHNPSTSSNSKIVNKSDSIESSAFRKSLSSSSSSDLATSAIIEPSKSGISTVEGENLKPKAGQSKNVIHVDILSDLWEDWAKSDETEEELSPVKAFNGLTKDFSGSTKETSKEKKPNEKEILGTFFLNDVSDESSEEIEPEVDDDDGEEEEKGKKENEMLRDEKRNPKEGDEKQKDEQKEVKKEKSTEPGRKKSLVKDETTLNDHHDDHQHETISSSLTPKAANGKEDSLSQSMDKKSNMSTHLMSSQSKVISPPLPSPPPPSLSPPPASILPPPPPALLSTPSNSVTTFSSSSSSYLSTLPPALPPRPIKEKVKPTQRSSIEVQTELDSLIPRLEELERLKRSNEEKVKHLEIEITKQNGEFERNRAKLVAELKLFEDEKLRLERRLNEMMDSQKRLIEENKSLTENGEKLKKQLEFYEECKCNQLKEELKVLKEKAKSQRNYNNDEFIRKLHDLNDECNDLRRELSKEQTALRDEISQLEKDKEVFKLENQWLKEKLEEMRDQMRKHLSSQVDDHQNGTRFGVKRKKRKEREEKGKKDDEKEDQKDDGEYQEDDQEDDEDKTLEEMRKVMVTIECLLTKLDDKISGLNLEEQKKLMEKIIVEIAKSQINQQVETMFKGIRILLEDLQQELNSFQLTIKKQMMNGQIKDQSNGIEVDSKDDSPVNRQSIDNHQDSLTINHPARDDTCDLLEKKTTSTRTNDDGFALFESRISQLTSSIEKLEDNIEHQEMKMLIRTRGHFWSNLDENDGRSGQENSMLINLFNGVNRKKSFYPEKPQSGFVQSLMRLQSTGRSTNLNNKIVNYQVNYEPALLFDFHYTKNNLSKQIANLKSELGLTS